VRSSKSPPHIPPYAERWQARWEREAKTAASRFVFLMLQGEADYLSLQHRVYWGSDKTHPR